MFVIILKFGSYFLLLQGMLGADMTGLPFNSATEEVSTVNRLAIIAGTSSCHMAVS